MRDLYEYSDPQIAIIFIGAGFASAIVLCIGLCGMLHSVSYCKRRNQLMGGPSGHRHQGHHGHQNNGLLVKEQSQSVLRGEHPIAFVLPTVPYSEPCSEYSDLESLTNTTVNSASSSRAISSPRSFSAAHLNVIRHMTTKSRSDYDVLNSSQPEWSDCSELSHLSETQFGSGGGSCSNSGIPVAAATSAGKEGQLLLEGQDEEQQQLQQQQPQPQIGNIKVKLAVKEDSKIELSEILISKLSLGSSKIYIKIRAYYPDYESTLETSPTTVFDNNAMFLECFVLEVENKHQIHPVVLKLSLCERNSSGLRKVLGQSLINLSGLLPIKQPPVFVTAKIGESVAEELAEIFSDAIELSLNYDEENGKLTLGILQAKMACNRVPFGPNVELLYAKVTLFDEYRVMKAKKTRPVGVSHNPQFHEMFTILFPKTYLDRVSCIISLCMKTKQGSKQVRGRVNVGPANFVTDQGLQHWTRMVTNTGATIIQWHRMV